MSATFSGGRLSDLSDARPSRAEFLDDLTLEGPVLERSLHELVWINRFLGGYSSLWRVLGPLLRQSTGSEIRIIDFGSGLADTGCFLVRSADRLGARLHITAIEGNPAAVAAARKWVEAHLPPRLRRCVDVECRNVWDVDDSREFDIAVASLFLHHFPLPAAVALLRKMNRMGRLGIVISDLHRHVFAYHAIRAIGWLFRTSNIFRNDAPLSVLRGYRRQELLQMAGEAGLRRVSVRRHWAFRWILSTL